MRLVLFSMILSLLLLVHPVPSPGQLGISSGLDEVHDIEIDHSREQIIAVGRGNNDYSYDMAVWQATTTGFKPIYTHDISEVVKDSPFTEWYTVDLLNSSLYLAGHDGFISEYNYDPEVANWTFEKYAHRVQDTIRNVQFLSDDLVLLVNQQGIHLFQNGERITEIQLGDTSDDRIRFAAYHYVTDRIIVQDFSDQIMALTLNGTIEHSFGSHEGFAISAFTSNIILVDANAIEVYTPNNGSYSIPFEFEPGNINRAAQENPNATYFAMSSGTDLQVIRLDDGSRVLNYENEIDYTTIEWLNTYQFFTGSSNGTVTLWDLRTNSSRKLLSDFGNFETENSPGERVLDFLSEHIPLVILVILLVILIPFLTYRRLQRDTQEVESSHGLEEEIPPDSALLYPDTD